MLHLYLRRAPCTVTYNRQTLLFSFCLFIRGGCQHIQQLANLLPLGTALSCHAVAFRKNKSCALTHGDKWSDKLPLDINYPTRHHMRWQWAYSGSWEHLDRLGVLAPFFRSLPEWARPCPMSVDLMRGSAQLGALFALSAGLRWGTQPALSKAPDTGAADVCEANVVNRTRGGGSVTEC